MGMSETDGSADTSAKPFNPIQVLVEGMWEKVVLADASWNPDKSCFDLASDYRHSSKSADDSVRNFINWQSAKAGTAGFMLGLPGLPFLPFTVPADLAATTYLHLRMIAVIGLLYEWDIRSDQFRTVAFASLGLSQQAEAVRAAGAQMGAKFAAGWLKRLPGRALKPINRFMGYRFITKAGTTGTVNLVKFVPIVGGVVSGSVNAASTHALGRAAAKILKSGPGEDGAAGGTDGNPHEHASAGELLDGEAEGANFPLAEAEKDERDTVDPSDTPERK